LLDRLVDSLNRHHVRWVWGGIALVIVNSAFTLRSWLTGDWFMAAFSAVATASGVFFVWTLLRSPDGASDRA
jgi:hypothetical protein